MLRGSRLGLLIAIAATGSVAHAHGPAPAVLEVLAVDERGPTWLRATVGLLRREPDGTWTHVCPAHWDGNDRMQAAVADDTPLVVSVEGHLGAADRCEPWTNLGAVRFAAADEDALYWIASGGELSLVTAEGTLGLVPPAIGAVTSLVASEGRVAVGGRLGVAVWGDDWTVWPLPDRLRYVRALTADAVYGSTAMEGRLLPERIGLTDGAVSLGPPADQLFGPASFAGEMRVFADGDWIAERGGEWVSLGADDRRWTCVATRRGATYGCSLDGLFRLDAADKPAAERVFSFVQIAPSPCALCEPDWAHFGGESGWVDTRASSDPDGQRQPIPEGCSVGGGGDAGWWLALALTLRRRRRRPGR